MKAIKVSDYGEADVLKLVETEPKPRPSAGQALIKIHAAGVNFVDIYQRRGNYPIGLPYVPGLEASGQVAETGENVTMVRSGDRVAYAGHLGSYGEYTVIYEDKLIPLPDWMSYEEGAAFPLQAMTAHYLLHEFRKPRPDDAVLIHAAAGGVGNLLVQWAKHMGAFVAGTVSTEEKAAAARQAGADHVVLYTKQDFVSEIRRVTGGRGADLILDGVGKSTFRGDLEAVSLRGHVVVYGASSGPAEAVSPNSFMQKSISVSGGSLMNFTATRADLLRRSGDALEGIRTGWLKLRIDRVLPLEEAAEAHRLLEGRKTMGKLVLKVA